MENWHSCVWYKNSHIRYLDFIQDFQDAACAAVTLQVYLFCGNYWEFKITSWSISHKKVHSACLEHLAPTDGTPGIGNGCQIKLAFKAAGEVNWRLGIQVDIGCWIELWNLKVGKSLKIEPHLQCRREGVTDIVLWYESSNSNFHINNN